MPDPYNPWATPIFPGDNAQQPYESYASPQIANILTHIAGALGRGFMAPGNALNSPTPLTSEQLVQPAHDMMGTMMGGAPMAERGAVGVMGGKLGGGLPMDEASRLARATEQGYTTEAYKGLYPYDYRTVPMTNFKGEVIDLPGNRNLIAKELTTIDSPSSPYAGFFSNQPAVANKFADAFAGGAVMPAKLKFENPLVIDAQGKPAAAFQFHDIAAEHGTAKEMADFRAAFAKDSGHDGVILKNTMDEGDVFVPRRPEQIRSKFAAFDPANIGKAGALGGLAGMMAAPIFAGQKQ